MRFSDLVSPVTPAHRDDRQLGQDDGTTDGSGHFLGTLHTQTNMPVVVPHSNKGLQRQADKSDTQSISSLFDNFELELSAVPVFFVFFLSIKTSFFAFLGPENGNSLEWGKHGANEL